MAFTYPFRYVPSPEVEKAAAELIDLLAADSTTGDGAAAGRSFSEGKMLGVLITDRGPLYSFSGLANGLSTIPGFVAPIFDYSAPDGYFRMREAEISAMQNGPVKSAASAELQRWLFSQYRVMNALGEEASILDIFASEGLVPPGGTGECAAPKLLDYAFRNGYKPLAMGEFWYGRSPESEVREQGRFYPSCTGKCGPLLTWMLRGIEVDPNPLDEPFIYSEPKVLYEDEAVLVVSKPAGMLSVPGRTAAPSLLGWLEERYGEVYSCHRLDMDTSGVMVFARSSEAKVLMEKQFAGREVHKTYRARLVSDAADFRHAKKGTIALPLALDYYDRPRQIVTDEGKPAVTRYEIVRTLPDGEIEVLFEPLTGRSHQLRVHAAHQRGLGRPIKGDALYGAPDGGPLFLHAESLEFRHPLTGKEMLFKD